MKKVIEYKNKKQKELEREYNEHIDKETAMMRQIELKVQNGVEISDQDIDDILWMLSRSQRYRNTLNIITRKQREGEIALTNLVDFE